MREIGSRVGAEPQRPEDGWPPDAWVLRFDLAGREMVWQNRGREHHVEWVTTDCASGVTLTDAKAFGPDDIPPFKRLKSGLSVLIPSTTWTTSLEQEARAWLSDADNVALLESLPLQPGEYVHFGWPGCTAILRDRTAGVLDRVAALVAASDRMVDPDSRWLAEVARKRRATVRWKSLPVEFRSLARFSRLWGEGDDQIRSDRMSRASTQTLIDLVGTVSPLFDAFAAYATKVADDPPEAYFRLERIIEAGAEAQLELERRG